MARIFFSLLTTTVILSACVPRQTGMMAFADGQQQHSVIAEDIRWQPCPPMIPKGCQMAILEGDPRQPDLFTVRFRLSEQFIMTPHTHPKDERVTILSGEVRVAFGLGATRQDAALFRDGDYYVNAPDAIHSVWIDRETILQITGIGPWQANFVTQP